LKMLLRNSWPHPNFDHELALSARPALEIASTPTADLLRRFNPKLVGFGIVSPPPCYFFWADGKRWNSSDRKLGQSRWLWRQRM